MSGDNITKIKKINITKFRALENIDIEFADRITVICGKNGMAKSSILGIAAQCFSFSKDYTQSPPVSLKFNTLSGDIFKSQISEHFRLSKYDLYDKQKINIVIYDGYEKLLLDKLELSFVKSQDREYPRPVLRNNSTKYNQNSSRNVTHPVIFLSVKRMIPIAQRDYKERTDPYINMNKEEICKVLNKILLKTDRDKLTATAGTLSSVVTHGSNYDYTSVSVGDDNAGQIVQAIFSFKKLKEEYSCYHGGLLLIDEADAGLFPAAQQEFIKILSKLSKELNIQIIMTSHSPTLIESVYNLSQKDKQSYKVAYLSDTYGKISFRDNISWPEIIADLRVEAISVAENIKLPTINIYVEDKEAYDFFRALTNKRKLSKIINLIKSDIGSNTLLQLVEKKIPEFYSKSIICLDGDIDIKKYKKYNNIITLPGSIPPDQLIFEYLLNKNPDDIFWHNNSVRKDVFLRETSGIIDMLEIKNINTNTNNINLKEIIGKIRQKNKAIHGQIRENFKNFYKSNMIKQMLVSVKTNPFYDFLNNNPDIKSKFYSSISAKLMNIYKSMGIPAENYFHLSK